MGNKAIILFGGSGDLTYRKLMPALYNLESLNKLDDSFFIISIGRRDYTTERYLGIVEEWIENYARTKFDSRIFQRFKERVSYFKMDLTREEEYASLKEFLNMLKIGEHYYYFAVAPSFFTIITNALKRCCAFDGSSVIVEKPFGENLEQARILNGDLETYFGKENIYHIDHYLGKEMIQNILSIRFENAIFKGIWNKEFIENIQITAHEEVGVETRAGYYDKAGALKDMVQNHLLQVLSIVGMEEPDEGNISEKQLELLNRIKPVSDIHSQLVMAQYEGYLNEPNISPKSRTETYVALKVEIDNDRWSGVPFYIRTGKFMKKRETKVVITFKSKENRVPNILVIRIQPDEGVYFQFNIKKPGSENELETVRMDFCQSCVLANRINTPEAYERLLEAVFKKDLSMFSKWDQIVVSWNYANDIMEKFQKEKGILYIYEKGGYGPGIVNSLVNWVNEE